LQQDITRGRGMVDELFQGFGGTAGTQNAIMSSSDYVSQVHTLAIRSTLASREQGRSIRAKRVDHGLEISEYQIMLNDGAQNSGIGNGFCLKTRRAAAALTTSLTGSTSPQLSWTR
jgi:hypothetical protein